MSRHTLNDGVTPDPEINGQYNQHWVELAPPPHLIGSYYKRGLSWEDFEEKYLAHLQTEPAHTKILQLISLAKTQDITLCCIEETANLCHRRLIVEECLRLDPELETDIDIAR